MRDNLFNLGKELSPLNLFLMILVLIFVGLCIAVGVSVLLKGIISIKNRMSK